MRYVITIAILLLALSSDAQTKNFEKAKAAFAGGNLKSACKLADKCLEHPETKNNPAVLLLKSKIMFAIHRDGSLSEKYPGANKDALKFAEKALEANRDEKTRQAFKTGNLDYFRQLVKQNNKEAIEALNQKKYARALPLFKKSMFFGLDTISMVYAAECYWNLDEKPQSIPLYKAAADMIYPAVLDSNTRVSGYHKEPFRKLCLYYIARNDYDSAYLIVKNGREILPADPVLNEYTYRLMRHILDKIPPSQDYLNTVLNALKDFPADSFLNHRENSIYLFLLNGLAQSNDMVNFDSLLQGFARGKERKANLKQFSNIRRYDIFAGMKAPACIREIKNYFAYLDLKAPCYSTWLVENRLRTGQYLPSEQDGLELAFRSENNAVCIRYITERHLELNGKDLKFSKARSNFLKDRNSGKTASGYRDLLALIRMNEDAAKEFPKDLTYTKAAKEYRLRLISESADSSDFKLCRQIWTESSAYRDLQEPLRALWRKQIEADFRINYFGSRINLNGKQEKGVPEYTWNGNADSCRWGSMPDVVMLRAEQRINYFRRMAGLDEDIMLSKQDNENCMYAALMCEANKSMSHEPSEGWRCFIPEGLEALKTSILSKDGNPAMAITAAMGQNHPSAGNRRWLLYPRAQYMGIGSSRTYTAIRAVDHSRLIDSMKYRTKAVCWPPANECPRMLVFKKWSFTLDTDLDAAIVSMQDSKGNSIPLKQEAPMNGYGLNTLVWEPEINSRTLEPDEVLQVSIRLKNGNTYKYSVKIIDVPLN